VAAGLTAADLAQLAAAGIRPEEAERQLALLASPPPRARLLRAATPGDGVLILSEARRAELERRGREAADAGRLSKFVPASGAATRMFRALIAARERGLGRDPAALAAAAAAGDADAVDAARFGRELGRLALARPLAAAMGVDLPTLARRAAAGPLEPILATLLDAGGLDAARRPKALLPFHEESGATRSAFDDQLAEGLAYVRGASGEARIHFTISPGARPEFEAALGLRAAELGAGGTRCTVDFSEQSPATDTRALDERGRPARDRDGRPLLRPAGHGALLPNLEATRGDLVSIKNVDNVLPRARHEEIGAWKRVLAGLLVELEASPDAGAPRPTRVCGVVRNAGEPGGGPFWVESGAGATLQIVESSQVDLDDPAQRALWASSTHFNPVDLVVALRAPDGRPHELERHLDPAAAIVTAKSEGGRDLRVLERPGLWNGAMAGWRTVFVEVPAWTFAPVKTVLDLARPEHAAR
jgi:hypothetical protein